MFYFDRRWIYIILAVLIVITLVNYITNPMQLLNLLLAIPGVIIAITFHEFAHAYVADKLGDDTARRQGRLNLNPLSHIDPVGFALLLFAGFGWGRPVQINPRNFTRKMTVEKAEAIVSVAGPLMNFILAIIFSIVLGVFVKLGVNLPSNMYILLISVIISIISMNIGLGVFNLIPLPPLDGYKILKNFLPYNVKVQFEEKEQIFYIIFLVLWITGLSGTIISPIINWILRGMLTIVGMIFGIII